MMRAKEYCGITKRVFTGGVKRQKTGMLRHSIVCMYCDGYDSKEIWYMCTLTYTGKRVTQDYEEAFYWFEKAANQRHAWAQCNLGLAYEVGRGVEQRSKGTLKGSLFQKSWKIKSKYILGI